MALLAAVPMIVLSCSRRPASHTSNPAKPARLTIGPADPRKPVPAKAESQEKTDSTDVLVHNVILHTGTQIKLKVKWLRGKMYPTSAKSPASFDDTKSFRLQIEEGLVSINVADLSAFLKQGALKTSPLRNAKIQPQDGRLKITGTLKKLVPLPIEMMARLGVSPDQKHVRMHVEKLSILKIPFKGLLGVFRVQVDDLFDPKNRTGIDVKGNDIDIDVNQLLPPPKAEGRLTKVKVLNNGDLLEYYGKPREDGIPVTKWRNFMRLRGGVVNIGKLTMHHTDMLLVDKERSGWLNFDIKYYQEQLVNGTTEITPEAGLRIFIADINKLQKASSRHSISKQWNSNLNVDPPPDMQ